MEYSIKIHTIRQDSSFYILRDLRLQFPRNTDFLPMEIGFVLANSAGPHEMSIYVAYHLGLHCAPKYPFRGFQCI